MYGPAPSRSPLKPHTYLLGGVMCCGLCSSKSPFQSKKKGGGGGVIAVIFQGLELGDRREDSGEFQK